MGLRMAFHDDLLQQAFQLAQKEKSASNRILNSRHFPFLGEDPAVVDKLRAVAAIFASLQERRHTADYDKTIDWSRSGALREIEAAEKVFQAWKAIRHERIAQEYLVSLLVKHRG
jgi:hypothetical protein